MVVPSLPPRLGFIHRACFFGVGTGVSLDYDNSTLALGVCGQMRGTATRLKKDEH
jgi:hypothetical protein